MLSTAVVLNCKHPIPPVQSSLRNPLSFLSGGHSRPLPLYPPYSWKLHSCLKFPVRPSDSSVSLVVILQSQATIAVKLLYNPNPARPGCSPKDPTNPNHLNHARHAASARVVNLTWSPRSVVASHLDPMARGMVGILKVVQPQLLPR